MNIPLCLDLDGTLLRTDTLYESVLALVKLKPRLIFFLPFWLITGKSGFKKRLAMHIIPEPGSLPFRQSFVEWARKESSRRPVFLTTAAHMRIARPIAEYLGFFSGIIATENKNLSAHSKAQALIEKFGDKGFDYAGNARDDLAVWHHSRHAILVDTPATVTSQAERAYAVSQRFDLSEKTLKSSMMDWLTALRIYQWVKNLPIFLAPLAAHTLLDVKTLRTCVAAYLIFGCAASLSYLINDLLDLAADRAHPRKCRRPFASGRLSLRAGMAAIPLLGCIALVGASQLNWQFFLILLTYLVLTTMYSVWLKRLLFVDVAVLAMLYTLRVVAGGCAASVSLSFWLLALCAYGFLSLALTKRYAELISCRSEERCDAQSGRSYRVPDLPVVLALGVGTGLVATLVMALYLESQTASRMYTHPHMLWSLVGLMTLAMGRLWLSAGRGEMHDDPILYIARDPACIMIILMAMLTIKLAI